MMAYANVGDVYGMESIYEKYENMGFASTTSTMNIVLKTIINTPNLDWNHLKAMKENIFHSNSFIPDINTYIQLLLACDKYDKKEDAIVWFNEFINLDKDIEVTQLIKNIYRQVVENDNYDPESLKRPIWETTVKFDTKDDLDNSIDYNTLWSKANKKFVDNGEFDDNQKVHPKKVCGVDDDLTIKNSYSSSPESYRKIICARIATNQPISIGLFNNLLLSYIKLKDYKSSKKLFFEEALLYKVTFDPNSINHLLTLYVEDGDPFGAEKLLEYSLSIGIPVGELCCYIL